jgi:hypothetical protein
VLFARRPNLSVAASVTIETEWSAIAASPSKIGLEL